VAKARTWEQGLGSPSQAECDLPSPGLSAEGAHWGGASWGALSDPSSSSAPHPRNPENAGRHLQRLTKGVPERKPPVPSRAEDLNSECVFSNQHFFPTYKFFVGHLGNAKTYKKEM